MSTTPLSFTFDLDGHSYAASFRGVTEGVGPRYAVYRRSDSRDVGLVWHCAGGPCGGGWKTWRGGTAHPDIQSATRERLSTKMEAPNATPEA